MVEGLLDIATLLLDHDIVVNVNIAASCCVHGLSLCLDLLLLFSSLASVGSFLLHLLDVVEELAVFCFLCHCLLLGFVLLVCWL